MKRFVHYISDDIEEIRGYPRWQWLFVPSGFIRLTSLLKAHAELQRKHPEEISETDD